jgi:hypothetical protein
LRVVARKDVIESFQVVIPGYKDVIPDLIRVPPVDQGP